MSLRNNFYGKKQSADPEAGYYTIVLNDPADVGKLPNDIKVTGQSDNYAVAYLTPGQQEQVSHLDFVSRIQKPSYPDLYINNRNHFTSGNQKEGNGSSKSNSTYNFNNMNSGYHDKDLDEHLNKMYGAGNHKGITRSSRRNRKGSNPMDLSFNSFFNF